MRRISMVIGFMAAVAGAWELHHLRAEVAACAPPSAGFGVTPSCLNQVGKEYLSFGVLMGGLFVLALALLLMRRERLSKKAPVHAERDLIGTPGGIPLVRRQAELLHRSEGGGSVKRSSPPRTSDDRTKPGAPLIDTPIDPPGPGDRK
jgi:hypothetical protein